jgi:hypothetical protein
MPPLFATVRSREAPAALLLHRVPFPARPLRAVRNDFSGKEAPAILLKGVRPNSGVGRALK